MPPPFFAGHRLGMPGSTVLGSHRAAPRPQVPVPIPKPKLLKQIVAGSIHAIDDASGNGASPVWIVTLTSKDETGQHDQLVVKEERQFSNSRGNVGAMNQIMTTVSPSAAMEVLDQPEWLALDTFASRPAGLAQAARSAWLGQTVLLKMKYDPRFYAASNRPVDGQSRAMDEDDKAKATHLFNGLRANTKAWQTLGQVAIADNLIGNNDRIAFDGWTVTNFGNLIFSRDAQGKITHALGYDAVDPYGGPAKQIFGTDIEYWTSNFGCFIKEKHTFVAAAHSVVRHINEARMEPLGLAPFGKNIAANEAQFLAQGLMIGWDKLANAIGMRVRNGRSVPSGLMARARYLGWVK